MINPNIPKRFQKIIYNRKKYPTPNPFCFNKKNVKAIVLGTDPVENVGSNNKILLNTVFGIGEGTEKYFRDIYFNLNQIGLNLGNIYVQNVIPFYLKDNTKVNLLWNEIAQATLPSLLLELDSFDKKRRIPVLLTSEIIYTFLLSDFNNYHKPVELYEKRELVPINPSNNKLGRKLYPLYSSSYYKLGTKKWSRYTSFLKKNFKK